jgi:competence protein ComEA
MLDRIESYRWLIVAILAVPVLAGTGTLLADRADRGAEPLVVEDGGPPDGDIRVYVTGAVANPGVYGMAPNLRWIDAVEAAGGHTSSADLQSINLATRLSDEDMIVVPSLGDSAAVAGHSAAGSITVVNINSATEAELDTLPGIGEVRAGRIVSSRNEVGPFTAIEDLLARELVPDSVFDEIAPLISVN